MFCIWCKSFALNAKVLRVVQKVLFSLYPRTEVLGCGKVLGYGPRLGVLTPGLKSRVVWVNPGLKSEVAYILDAHLSFPSPGLKSRSPGNPGLKSEVAYILDAHLFFRSPGLKSRSPGLKSGVENLPAFRKAAHFN